MDLEDLKKNRWVPRGGEKGPKTINEVREEVEKEQQVNELERIEVIIKLIFKIFLFFSTKSKRIKSSFCGNQILVELVTEVEVQLIGVKLRLFFLLNFKTKSLFI